MEKNDNGEYLCPTCGSILITSPWWDDPLAMGGAVIGYLFDCPECGFHDSE